MLRYLSSLTVFSRHVQLWYLPTLPVAASRQYHLVLASQNCHQQDTGQIVDKLVFPGRCQLCSSMISLIYLKKSQSFSFVDPPLRVKICTQATDH